MANFDPDLPHLLNTCERAEISNTIHNNKAEHVPSGLWDQYCSSIMFDIAMDLK